MDYVVVAVASEAAYGAKRAYVHSDDRNLRMRPFSELTHDEHVDVAHRAADAIRGIDPRDMDRSKDWRHADHVFYLVARIVARAMMHDVLDDGDPDPMRKAVEWTEP